MNLSRAVEAYITHKRSLGMRFRTEAVCLRAFVQSVGNSDMNRVRTISVNRFLDGEGPLTSFWFGKYYALTGFYRFALARHYVRKSPLPHCIPKKPNKFQPYIYTNDDMRRLMNVAGSLHPWHLTPQTTQTLLLLLYATGLRISEALRLNLEDFDRGSGILTIRGTKFFKSRLVPVGPDLRRVLEVYVDQQWPPDVRTESTPLLATIRNERIARHTVELVHKRLREEAGVRRPPEARYQPRLHDFRHTFAVVRLVTWYREGKDVQRLLPHLSTYLGHCRIQDTACYLTMTAELLDEASRCFEHYAQPEVSHA